MNLIHPQNLRLRPFQAELVTAQLENFDPYRWQWDACEMRLGKTVMAGVLGNTLLNGKSGRFLFIVPAALRLNWIEENNKWLMPNVEFAVISYNLLVARPQLLQEVLSQKWDLIIFDEFHYCKNIHAARTIASFLLWDSATFGVRMLSGTPLTKSATDLYPALAAVTSRLPDVSKETRRLCADFDTFGSHFAYRYNSYYGGSATKTYKGVRVGNLPQLLDILYRETKMMYVKTLAEVAPELPAMEYKIVPLELDVDLSEDPAKLREFEKAFSDHKDSEEPIGFSTVRRLLGVAKSNCKDVYEYIESYLEAGLAVIIMCAHTEVVQTVGKFLKKWKPVFYTGAESARAKQTAKDDFQLGRTNVFIGNILAAGVGINLSRASHTIMLEVDWLSINVTQALKRMVSMDKHEPCMAHFFVSKNEFDQKMIRNLVERQKQIERVI